MRIDSGLGVGTSLLVAAFVSACAGGSDSKSRQLMAISHVASSPYGALSISDDGSYAFVDSEKKSETRGALSSSELDAVKDRVESPRLDDLYQQRNKDDDACAQSADGYVLSSRLGAGCFVPSAVNDKAAQEDLAFFMTLFNEKSVTK